MALHTISLAHINKSLKTRGPLAAAHFCTSLSPCVEMGWPVRLGKDSCSECYHVFHVACLNQNENTKLQNIM